MSSEDKATPQPKPTEAEEESKDQGSKEEKMDTAATEPDDEGGEDQLVIDEPEEKSDGESDEKEFEPTLDMMMNDFDDEQTMEEEEANEDQENEEDELAALEQEQDMPIEELLKMYGAVPADQENSEEPSAEDEEKPSTSEKKDTSESDVPLPPQDTAEVSAPDPSASSAAAASTAAEVEGEQDGDSNDALGAKRRGSDSPTPPIKKSKSELARFYEAAVEGRSLRSQGSGQAEEAEEDEEEEPEDSDQENRDYSWKKTIMIGPSYQASVSSDLAAYGDTLPYENEDKLLWNPGHLRTEEVESYLAKSQEALQAGGVGSLPLGAHVRDDEQALFLLLQCGYNCEEALRRRRMNAVPTAETMTLWSEEECRAFELGLRLYGKDFHMIQSQKVRTRSVGELVQFYYLWKKTERHDVFANNTRLEKKKYTLHPGTTDYMDRFIDEQDPSRDRSSSPNFYSLMFGSAEGRKGLSLLPAAGASKSQMHLNESNGTLSQNHPPTVTSAPLASNNLAASSQSSSSTSASSNGRVEKANEAMSEPTASHP